MRHPTPPPKSAAAPQLRGSQWPRPHLSRTPKFVSPGGAQEHGVKRAQRLGPLQIDAGLLHLGLGPLDPGAEQGLEPPRVTPLEPKSSASTSSATLA